MIAPACLVLVLLAQAPVSAYAQTTPVAASVRASAAVSPVVGAWRAEYKTSEGRTHSFVLTFETKDGVLGGTVSSPRGSVPITAGKVDGRTIAFTVLRRANYDEIAVVYQGTIDRDTMRLTIKVGARPPIAFTARRDHDRSAATVRAADSVRSRPTNRKLIS